MVDRRDEVRANPLLRVLGGAPVQAAVLAAAQHGWTVEMTNLKLVEDPDIEDQLYDMKTAVLVDCSMDFPEGEIMVSFAGGFGMESRRPRLIRIYSHMALNRVSWCAVLNWHDESRGQHSRMFSSMKSVPGFVSDPDWAWELMAADDEPPEPWWEQKKARRAAADARRQAENEVEMGNGAERVRDRGSPEESDGARQDGEGRGVGQNGSGDDG